MNNKLNVGFFRGICLAFSFAFKYVKPLVLIFLIVGFTFEKPRLLIIGDSISQGYFPFVKQALSDKAMVEHNTGNAQDTWHGLKNTEQWLGKDKWDVIQFNWGLWDLCHRSINASGELVKDVNGKVSTTPEQYRENLDSLVTILQKTGARLVFVTTTHIPEDSPGRLYGDEMIYNAIAEEVMKKRNVQVSDINSVSKKIHHKHGKAPGNVHYTEEGYKELSVPIINTLRSIIIKE
jgi:hypothetical protein